MSARTLERLIMRQTGMSFRCWRQQLAVLLAIDWLAAGASMQEIAAQLRYENVSSFATMFRQTLGTALGRYMAERHARQ